MKKATAFFHFSMTVQCPWCWHTNDLEESDKKLWIKKMRSWLNNARGADRPKVEHVCDECSGLFLINNIDR